MQRIALPRRAPLALGPLILALAAVLPGCSAGDTDYRIAALDEAGGVSTDVEASSEAGSDTGDDEDCECQYVEEDMEPNAEVCTEEADTEGDGGSDDGWGTTGVAAAQEHDFDLSAQVGPQADKKGGKCYPPYPSGCGPLDGTKIMSVRWMEQFRQATASNPWVNAPLTFNQLTDAQVDQIIANCKDKPTEIEKLVCVAKAVDVAVDGTEDASGDYVCRHHMGSLYKVLKKMGYGDTATGSVTHAWNEVEIDTNGDGVKDTIVVLDSYNGIYYTVPK